MGSETYGQRLDEFAKLKEDWDSYGAEPMDPDMLASVRVFLDAVVAGRASLVPTRSGGVQIEIHEQGTDVEVEFDPAADDDSHGSVFVAWGVDRG